MCSHYFNNNAMRICHSLLLLSISLIQCVDHTGSQPRFNEKKIPMSNFGLIYLYNVSVTYFGQFQNLLSMIFFFYGVIFKMATISRNLKIQTSFVSRSYICDSSFIPFSGSRNMIMVNYCDFKVIMPWKVR